MNRYIKITVITAVLIAIAALVPVLANAQVNGSDDVGSAPVTSGNTSSTGTTPLATNGVDDVAISTSVTSGATSNGSTPTVINGGDDITSGSNNPSNPGNGDGGTGGGGPSGSAAVAAGSSVSFLAGSTSTPILTGACVYLNDYLKIGGTNNNAEVLKLQIFLKNTEKIDVDQTGTFDDKTFEAVKAFQAKYLSDVMGPWGVTTPTGQVWYTTKKKINEIFCKAPFALTAEQQGQIDAYKAGLANGTLTATNASNATTSPEIGSIDNGSQTAAVGGISIGAKIWNFIKWLFGY